MTDLILPRRKFLTGLVCMIAAPAVVRAASLMPVKAFEPAFDIFKAANPWWTQSTYDCMSKICNFGGAPEWVEMSVDMWDGLLTEARKQA